MKFRKNGLKSIAEDEDEYLEMENDDIDELLKINDKIKMLETQRDENLDVDPTNRKMYEVAEAIIEAELQARNDELFKKKQAEELK